jgi:pimeloyl-ACP methyl ester carboxylesterase
MGTRPARSHGSPEIIRDRIRSLPRRFQAQTANGLSAEWELRIGEQTFAVAVGGHVCVVREGPGRDPATTIWVDPETWLAIDEGSLIGPQAYMERRLAVTGNLDLAVRLQTLFRPFKRPRRATDLDQVVVKADGIEVSAFMVGKGRPLLLLHGLGASKISWVPVLAPLAEHHRVIVPDLPGHGESEKPMAEYSPRFFAKVMRQFMSEIGVDEAVIVGNSLGGRVALELALRSPNRVSALALLDPSIPGFRARYILGFTRVFPSQVGAIPFPVRERWMVNVMARLFADPSRLPPDALAAAARDFIRVYRDPRARMAFFASLRHVVTERPEPFFGSLRRVKQPTLILFGALDRLVPGRLGVRLAEHLPQADLRFLPNVGHVPQFEATEETLAALGTFMSGLPRRKAQARRA